MRKLNPRYTERIVFSSLFAISLVILMPISWVFFTTLKYGLSLISWEFLTKAPDAITGGGGIFPAIIGTVMLVTGTLIFCLPVGLGAAIYLSEYSAKNTLTRLIRIGIITLSGVPSIVYGLFGAAFFVIFLGTGRTLIAGSLTLALMILPVVITASREAIDAVPAHFREVSLSLGATRWQTIRHAVLPHALSGILTGTILGIGRAAGETAPILFIATSFTSMPRSLLDVPSSGFMTLPTYLYSIFSPGGKIITNPNAPYGVALVLIALVFLITLPAIVIRARLRKKRKW